MMLHRTIILVLTAGLFLVAGVAVGRLSVRLAAQAPGTPGSRSWLADQLKLSPDQRQAMDAIWAQTRQEMGKIYEQRRALDKQRDQAVRQLLTDAQRTQYDQLYTDFHQQRQELDQEREKLMADANGRSRALLDDGQQKRWDALTKERMHQWHGGTHMSATMPASAPADAN